MADAAGRILAEDVVGGNAAKDASEAVGVDCEVRGEGRHWYGGLLRDVGGDVVV